ncbi:MAG: sulfur carrier protein ThiS [Bacteroidota bacterium]
MDIDSELSGIAVAINWSVVPRSQWTDTTLKAGDEVELITARQGG